MQAERFIEFIKRKGSIPYADAYRMIHVYFPDFRDYEGILAGAVQSGQVVLVNTAKGMMLQATEAAKTRISPDTEIA